MDRRLLVSFYKLRGSSYRISPSSLSIFLLLLLSLLFSAPVSAATPLGVPDTTTSTPAPATVANHTSWQYKLVPTGDQGTLYVRPPGVASWGVVCDDNFGDAEANVGCRSVGFRFGRVFMNTDHRSDALGGSVLFANVSQRTVYMDEVRCTGSEQFLAACYFTDVVDCTHDEAVQLQCTNTDSVLFIVLIIVAVFSLCLFLVAGRFLWQRYLATTRRENLDENNNGTGDDVAMQNIPRRNSTSPFGGDQPPPQRQTENQNDGRVVAVAPYDAAPQRSA